MTQSVFCDACGTRLPPGQASCPSCGAVARNSVPPTSAENATGFCNGCGAAFGADAEFCTNCGTRLAPAAPRMQAEVAPSTEKAASVEEPEVPLQTAACEQATPGVPSTRTGRSSGRGPRVAAATLLLVGVAAGVFFTLRLLELRDESSARSSHGSVRIARDGARSQSIRELSNREKLALQDYARGGSVIVIGGSPDSATVSMGTGFVVKRFGYRAVVATNRHVVVDETSGQPHPRFEVQTDSGYKHDALLLYADSDPDYDFALLSVRDDQQKLGQEVAVGVPPAVGDPVVCVGSPIQPRLIVSDGHLTAVDAAGGLFVADCLGEHGSSGGPVFSADNSVIGIQTWGLGLEERGDAQMAGRLLPDYWGRRLKVWQTTVNARGDWQDSNIPVAEGDEVQILALNRWNCGFSCGSVTAAGRGGYAQYAVAPACPHAGLIVTIGGEDTVRCVDQQWAAGMDPTGVVQHFVSTAPGTLRFRSNDRDSGNNSGTIDVLVAVRHAGP